MITVPILIDRIKYFINTHLNELSKNTPIIGFIKPVLNRVTNNSINKASKTLSLLADENGEIDITNLVSEMTESLMTVQPFVVNTSFIGDILIGNGEIRINVPLTDKHLVFNSTDLQKLKEILTDKN